MADDRRDDVRTTDENRDPISGAPGAHPVGTGVGTAVGGAAAGVAAGMAAGPVGTVAGAIIGGVAGAFAGKAVAESVDPTAEDAYWREHHTARPYYDKTMTYDDYRPAYQYGWESQTRYAGKSWDEAEPDMERDWESAKAHSRLSWQHARHATRDAWDRVINSPSAHDRPVAASEEVPPELRDV